MCLCDVLERVDLVDLDSELACPDESEQLGRVLLPLFPGLDVPEQDGTQELDVFGSETEDIEGFNWTGLFFFFPCQFSSTIYLGMIGSLGT